RLAGSAVLPAPAGPWQQHRLTPYIRHGKLSSTNSLAGRKYNEIARCGIRPVASSKRLAAQKCSHADARFGGLRPTREPAPDAGTWLIHRLRRAAGLSIRNVSAPPDNHVTA